MQFLRQRPFWKQSLKFIVGFDWTAEMNFIISESFIKFMSVLAGACSRFGSCQSSLLSKCCCSISTGWRQIFAQCIFWVLILFFIKFSQFSQFLLNFARIFWFHSMKPILVWCLKSLLKADKTNFWISIYFRKYPLCTCFSVKKRGTRGVVLYSKFCLKVMCGRGNIPHWSQSLFEVAFIFLQF